MPDYDSIDPSKLRNTVSALTNRLAMGDYEGLCRLPRASRLSPAEIERVVRDYGRQLIPLPIPAFETVDIVPVSKSHPQQWSVVVPLWSKEEGRSDLSLQLTVEDSKKKKGQTITRAVFSQALEQIKGTARNHTKPGNVVKFLLHQNECCNLEGSRPNAQTTTPNLAPPINSSVLQAVARSTEQLSGLTRAGVG